MKIGIVAGEKSGDYLGAELIKAFKQRYPHAEFVGLCGPLMQEQGGKTLAEMDKISIMGIAGAVAGLFDILSIRHTIKKHMLSWQPDVFVGIDVPDFNLGLEIKLKEAGIPTVHYVSPTVWAWRGKRINKIKRAVNLMLTLFPFEQAYYQQHNTPVKYVGHPLARAITNWQVDESFVSLLRSSSEQHGNSIEEKKMIALLPGSRMSEVSRLAPIMLEACCKLAQSSPSLEFVIPAANQKLYSFLADQLKAYDAPVTLVLGHSRDALALCHIAVLASGTAALEAALFAKPMVVMYKVSKFNEWYAAQTMVVEHFSMPNHLTNPPVVPELIQSAATADNLIAELERLMQDQQHYQSMKNALAAIAPELDEDSGQLACDAIESLLKEIKGSVKTQSRS